MPMRTGTPLPELTGATEWLNGEPKRDDLVGSPLLVHFWSVSCHSCHEIMPQVVEWVERFGQRGMKTVSVHMPRSESDCDVDAVKADTAESGITWPMAIDSDHNIVDAFQNKYVPAFYVFDAEGNLRHFQAGDRGQKMLEGAVERVLRSTEAA